MVILKSHENVTLTRALCKRGDVIFAPSLIVLGQQVVGTGEERLDRRLRLESVVRVVQTLAQLHGLVKDGGLHRATRDQALGDLRTRLQRRQLGARLVRVRYL